MKVDTNATAREDRWYKRMSRTGLGLGVGEGRLRCLSRFWWFSHMFLGYRCQTGPGWRQVILDFCFTSGVPIMIFGV
jgi:hypothetical protein